MLLFSAVKGVAQELQGSASELYNYFIHVYRNVFIASPEFPIIFLPFLILYWTLPARPAFQKVLLLLLGYFIYFSLSPWYALSIFAYTFFVWITAALISKSNFVFRRNVLFVLGVVGSLSFLGFFKYYNFIGQQLEVSIRMLGLQWAVPMVDVILPLGISFYVFQAISYLHSIRYQNQSAASLLNLGLYLCFLPTLLAGPICRPGELLPQLESTAPRVIYPPEPILLLISSFIIKKVLLAAWLAKAAVDPVFADPGSFNGFELVLSSFAYGLQIYFDFSGYTDLANAVAMLLGYRLPLNFSLPYLASSLSEFWGRWHISLSRWIRDYIYIPLGGNRHGLLVTLGNLMVAMVLSGLWHGASLNYLIWGAFHGALLCFEKVVNKLAPTFRIGVIPTFCLVCLGWVFFRTPTLDAAFTFYTQMLDWRTPLSPEIDHLTLLLLIPTSFVVWIKTPRLLHQIEIALGFLPLWIRPLPFAILISAALAISPDGMPNFIYAKF